MANLRLRGAISLAHGAGWASKTLLHKSGETLPGRVLLKLAPNAITQLSIHKTVLLISATNGKTSTTKALVKIVSSLGEAATSASGSNLVWGAANALMNSAPYAVLEVDELHMPRVLAESKPKVVLLLNLTRDQLHRMHEVKRVADRWHEACTKASEATFVIDVDDPFLNYATKDAQRVIRISFGGARHPDGAVCPSCGAYLNWAGGMYDCECGLTNKSADKKLASGSAAYRNATLANIAGELIGAQPISIDEAALERSVVNDYSGVKATLRLTKNPASWTEALSGVKTEDVILVLNARQVDGIDTSWLWDVSFAGLKDKRVIVTGERALDMAYRLHVEGIESIVVETFDKAIKEFPRGSHVSVLAAYTAFFGLVNK